MESHADAEDQVMAEGSSSPNSQIDPKRARFPRCIVWTPLPLISWFVPFIGHLGICREDGVILDFAGPNFVCTDNFSFGAVARYLQISKEKVYSTLLFSRSLQCDQHFFSPNDNMTWISNFVGFSSYLNQTDKHAIAFYFMGRLRFLLIRCT